MTEQKVDARRSAAFTATLSWGRPYMIQSCLVLKCHASGRPDTSRYDIHLMAGQLWMSLLVLRCTA